MQVLAPYLTVVNESTVNILHVRVVCEIQHGDLRTLLCSMDLL
jgi:hypothetical protein